jgi:hypothetical protein
VSSEEPALVSLGLQGEVEYIALSHCWGKKHTLTTTMSNLESHCKMLPMSTLPRSFRDAVEITRKLSIKYLWIDSLCIIQDLEEDWQSESAIMGTVYKNAYLTISALDAVDSHSGFIHCREKTMKVRLNGDAADENLYARPPTAPWNSFFINAPLVNQSCFPSKHSANDKHRTKERGHCRNDCFQQEFSTSAKLNSSGSVAHVLHESLASRNTLALWDLVSEKQKGKTSNEFSHPHTEPLTISESGIRYGIESYKIILAVC